MKLSTKLLTGLAATTCVATPLVVLTGCAKTEDAYVVDVSDGYTPSDVHKLNSTAETTLTDAMKTWFNHVSLNRLTPIEEFKWSMGQVAKKIKDYSTEEKGIKTYTEIREITAGMRDFKVEDMIKRKVSYETKGGFHFDFIKDFTNAEELPADFKKLLYRAKVDVDYHITMKNVSMLCGDATAIASTLPLLNALIQGYSYGMIDLTPLFVATLPGAANNSSHLNVFPDLMSLSSKDHTWMFDIEIDAKVDVTAGDYKYGAYQFAIDREVDYETILLLEMGELLPPDYMQMLVLVGMISVWQSYYTSSLFIPTLVERIPSFDGDDIEKPIEMSNPGMDSIRVRFSDLTEDDVVTIEGFLGSMQIFGYSNFFAVSTFGREYELVSDKMEGTVQFQISDLPDTTLPSGTINETIYIPILNPGKWMSSIPVKIRVE